MTQPTAQPTLQPLVFLPPIGAAPLAAKQSKGEPATGGGTTQPVVFTPSAPTRTTSKAKTTAQPSVNLFDKAAAEYLAGKSPKARTSTPRVFLPLPAPVTKNAHETKLEIVTEPFVPTPEEAIPTMIVKQPLENRRRPRSPSDA